MQHTHSDRLERWLGSDAVARVSSSMRDWYGPPIALDGVPGKVYAARGGDFLGDIQAGQECNAFDRFNDWMRRQERMRRARIARNRRILGAFGSLNAIEAAASAGKYVDLKWNKTGVASNAIGNANDLWTRAGFPAAGAAGAAAPGGTNWSSASTGALPFTNPSTTDSFQPMSGWLQASVVNNSVMMIDRLSSVAKTMNSTATEAVTNTPTRYQNTTTGDVESAEGNFYFPSNPTTVLAATGHNWTVCQYTNSAGTATRSSPSVAGVSACVVGGIDLATFNWFMPLQSGDLGVQKITQMQCSAAVATGTIDFVLAHPLVIQACPVATLVCQQDYVYTAFKAVKVLDSACISWLELPKPATTATNYVGGMYLVSE